MRLVTHYVFTMGLLSLIMSMFTPYYLVLSGVVAIAGNLIIDGLGHKEVQTRRGITIPTRTPLTHTYPRSVVWGFLPVIPFLAFGFMYGDFPWWLLLAGVLVGPSHMFLDMFTEAGVYVRRRGKWRRYALAHFRYNNPLANGVAILLGFLMLVLSLHGSYHYYHHYEYHDYDWPF
ncbi:protein of unknown function DUF1286 [Metallosphaera sedula]|uniref:Membrane-bound metal-dependent hydrolase n=2 Tax=Metallosphaera sedula TaxID=43687 RepID=A4YIT4_METS5|nr:DUF1286 domain-containing protein [Metallosphaera sedula]ABP96336.1 protein of unknown function DUF1286 [Metallosphaera sedula DSM 5348]AIM28319.1 protein of unknown function DUF1286 [Metallosphaera sedula]AKV75119.1 hypothetical protein MsedA_2250 [Metallosphaera sedula]AKV77357.1 hypothetical protein MsedB_2252 [Metallosphaera sedula]AKV79608.1 hypothetical protein MsedC_2250 [Metallosphaera sedula]